VALDDFPLGWTFLNMMAKEVLRYTNGGRLAFAISSANRLQARFALENLWLSLKLPSFSSKTETLDHHLSFAKRTE